MVGGLLRFLSALSWFHTCIQNGIPFWTQIHATSNQTDGYTYKFHLRASACAVIRYSGAHFNRFLHTILKIVKNYYYSFMDSVERLYKHYVCLLWISERTENAFLCACVYCGKWSFALSACSLALHHLKIDSCLFELWFSISFGSHSFTLRLINEIISYTPGARAQRIYTIYPRVFNERPVWSMPQYAMYTESAVWLAGENMKITETVVTLRVICIIARPRNSDDWCTQFLRLISLSTYNTDGLCVSAYARVIHPVQLTVAAHTHSRIQQLPLQSNFISLLVVWILSLCLCVEFVFVVIFVKIGFPRLIHSTKNWMNRNETRKKETKNKLTTSERQAEESREKSAFFYMPSY